MAEEEAVPRAPLPIRFLATVAFVTTISIHCLIAAGPVLLCSIYFTCFAVAIQTLGGTTRKQQLIDLKKRAEYWRGWYLDAVVFGIVYICHQLRIWKFNVVGPAPGGALTQAQWKEWAEAHTKVASDDLLVCQLPTQAPGKTLMPKCCLIVSNHLSNIDGFCIKAALFPIVSKAMIKGSAFYFPVIGQILYGSGQCFVWGAKPARRVAVREKVYERCAEIIDNEVPLVFYPEGTRRAYGRLAPFRLGVIKFAIDHEYPILISVIHGSHISWPKGQIMVNIQPIYLKFSSEVICPRKTDNPQNIANAIVDRMLVLFEGIPGYDREKEKPIRTFDEYKEIQNQHQQQKYKIL